MNPLGIDVTQPRLSWKLATGERGARGTRQTAYQVLAAANPDDLAAGRNLLWDSGRVESAGSTQVIYGGPPLASRQRVWWQVRAWDEHGQAGDLSAPAWWEMGLLARGDWRAEWIGAALVGGPRTSIPCPFLRQTITLEAAPTQARLYVSALGLYEFSINGQRVGEHALGDGWNCGHVCWFGRQKYGDRPRLLAQLETRGAAGERQTFATDEHWRTSFGPLLEADLIMGESYDARLELTGWNAPGYDDQRWLPGNTITAQGAFGIIGRRGGVAAPGPVG